MHDALTAGLDHVAVAVADLDTAERPWRRLGGGLALHVETSRFRTRQLRFAGGGKLELLAPAPGTPPDNFVRRFLQRFGSRVHHVTLTVPDLGAAIRRVRRYGLDVVDVRADSPIWHEAFLRPSQVGGVIVQLAWVAGDDDTMAARLGITPQPPAADAARLLGATLGHPDVDAAGRLWRLLGATVDEVGDAYGRELECRWPRSPVTIRITQRESAGPLALRFATAGAAPMVTGLPLIVEF